ncbi:protein phosphatase, putative [Plasmodium vinckei brucechwatti]|uniref:Protein phosphatase, putative n=1 Tax=Plasmodium vinckei brucechwatti TaxID=119398 RepID=A0A6V7SIV0_PLAVN|nr:protein phosphatase, putative [Plasmodium vinckei brucechwatti]
MTKFVLPKLIFYMLTVSRISLIYINNVKELSYSFIDKVNTYLNWTKGNEYDTHWNNLRVYSNEIQNQMLANTKEKYELELLGRILSASEQPIPTSNNSASRKHAHDYDTVSTIEDDNISCVLPNSTFSLCLRNFISSLYKKKKDKKHVSPIPTPISHIVASQVAKNKNGSTPDLQPYSINCTIRKFPNTNKTSGYCIKGKNYMVLAREGVPNIFKMSSRAYVSYFLTLFRKFANSNKEIKSQDAIEYAYENNNYKGEISICAIVINDDNTISASIVGNQQYIIIRDGQIAHKGQYKNAIYNCLHTIGNNKNKGINNLMNEEVPVEKGDIIISGSNIIWAVLLDDQILAIASSVDFSMLSKAIARSTYIYAISELNNASENCNSIGFINEKCMGISDDISVACARIN